MVKFTIEKNNKRPKYLLLSDGIIKQISEGQFRLGQKLPSVNKLSKEFNFSRETVFKAYNYLSEKGTVKAVDKIGYFVNDLAIEKDFRVFFMLDKFTPFKEDLYNSLVHTLGEKAKVSTYFHHQNIELFESLILQNLKNYTHFAIITYLKESHDLHKILDRIPSEKLILIDKREPYITKGYGMIYQDFKLDLFNALVKNIVLVKKYKKLILISDKNAPHGDFVKTGFIKFCKEYKCEGEVHLKLLPENFEKGNLYITIDAYDRDLVEIIKLVHLKKWELGNEIGLISYNDTPIKEVLNGGITTIGTDFKQMGVEAANMILNGKLIQKPNVTNMIVRNSL